MTDEDKVPVNCRECDHRYCCDSWYGGTACYYKDEISN